MDQLRTLSTGAKVVLAGTIAFLIVSFFDWFQVKDTDFGDNMWSGIGILAGLLAIALLVWQALRWTSVKLELGVSPSMITGALAVLLLIFTFIRFIDKPGGGIVEDAIERTLWSWLGLVFAIAVVAGAWMSMQAAGESLDDVRSRLSGLGRGPGTTTPPSAPPPPAAPDSTPPPAAPSEPAPDDSPRTP